MTDLHPGGPRTIDTTDAIPDGTVVPYYLSDRKLRLAIARVNGRLYAFDDLCRCTDEPCPLSGGLLIEATIMCQCHGSSFDLATGAVIDGHASAALSLYDVREVDGTIRVLA